MGAVCCLDRSSEAKTPRCEKGSARDARIAAREESESAKQQCEPTVSVTAGQVKEPESEEDPSCCAGPGTVEVRLDGVDPAVVDLVVGLAADQAPVEVAPEASLGGQASEKVVQPLLEEAAAAPNLPDGLGTARTADFLDTARSLDVLDVSAMGLDVGTKLPPPDGEEADVQGDSDRVSESPHPAAVELVPADMRTLH